MLCRPSCSRRFWISPRWSSTLGCFASAAGRCSRRWISQPSPADRTLARPTRSLPAQSHRLPRHEHRRHAEDVTGGVVNIKNAFVYQASEYSTMGAASSPASCTIASGRQSSTIPRGRAASEARRSCRTDAGTCAPGAVRASVLSPPGTDESTRGGGLEPEASPRPLAIRPLTTSGHASAPVAHSTSWFAATRLCASGTRG